jgi:3-phenylpropionate/trans-cinnamate dioxygenase ferredoxin subunit
VSRHVVATVDEIPPGGRKIVEVAGRSIGVFNLDGEYFALRNRCPHQGGELCLGPVSGFVTSSGPGDYHVERPGEFVRCPWHGWEFDIRTGQSWFDPGRMRVRRYDVFLSPGEEVAGRQAGDREMGPYVAESYVVSVDRHYVIVEVPS